MKNYFELKAEFKDFQERILVAEGEEKVELQKEYEEWRNEYGIIQYTKAWGWEFYSICPICEKNPCECLMKEIEVEPEEDEQIAEIIEQRDKEDNGVRYSLEDVKESLKEEDEE